MLNIPIAFLIGYLIGHVLGQTGIKDRLRKNNVDPRMYEDQVTLINKIINLVTGKNN